MKKRIFSLLLVMTLVFGLTACGGSDDANKENDSNMSQDAQDQNIDYEKENTQNDTQVSNENYESVELKSGNAVAKISYDPEQVSVKEYGSWMTLRGVVKDTILFNINIKECESAEAYAQSLVDEKEDWAAAKTSELEEVKFNSITAKHFTLSYNVKTYADKLDGLTQEEINQLEYTLEEKIENYYVIEVSEGVVLYVAYAVDEKMELLNYIVVEAIK